MADRSKVKDGSSAEKDTKGLVYTRKCGWIDLGHANPIGGAEVLWRKLRKDPPLRKSVIRSRDADKEKEYFKINYKQNMVYRGKISTGVRRWFLIKRNLTMKQRKAVALSILLNVTLGFEGYQGSFPYCLFIDSGFSCEDLVSNVISLYRAINPSRKYLEMCEPVSKEIALAIWDKYGSPGKYKNKILRPIFFPLDCKGSPRYGLFPAFLTYIKPVKPGKLFCRLKHGFTDKFLEII